jgi:uncharacterized DUF497 family protein
MKLRGFDSGKLEDVLRYAKERYLDTATSRMIAVGKHDRRLVLLAYEVTGDNEITPVTVHSTTRQQVSYRVRSGRFQP